MKKFMRGFKGWPAFVFFILLIFESGCVYWVVGSLGALGGYVISPDTVQGITNHEQSEIWDASIEILSIMGTIGENKVDGGIIMAKIQGAKVTVNILPVSSHTNRIIVKARKGIFPKIALAQEVYIKIMTHLNE